MNFVAFSFVPLSGLLESVQDKNPQCIIGKQISIWKAIHRVCRDLLVYIISKLILYLKDKMALFPFSSAIQSPTHPIQKK